VAWLWNDGFENVIAFNTYFGGKKLSGFAESLDMEGKDNDGIKGGVQNGGLNYSANGSTILKEGNVTKMNAVGVI
jgi:hypothetical protein